MPDKLVAILLFHLQYINTGYFLTQQKFDLTLCYRALFETLISTTG